MVGQSEKSVCPSLIFQGKARRSRAPENGQIVINLLSTSADSFAYLAGVGVY